MVDPRFTFHGSRFLGAMRDDVSGLFSTLVGCMPSEARCCLINFMASTASCRLVMECA